MASTSNGHTGSISDTNTNGHVNGQNGVTARPRRILYLTAPRSCSHLLMRMINIHNQPSLEAFPPEGTVYFMMPTMYVRSEQQTFHLPLDDIPAEKTAVVNQVRKDCAGRMEAWIHATENAGERVFLKEHGFMITNPVELSERLHGRGSCKQAREVVAIDGHSTSTQDNPTILPDDFLLSFTPTFLIRHPALTYASMKRGMTDAFGLTDNPTDAELARINLAGQYFNVCAIHDFFERRTGKAPVIVDASDITNRPETVYKYMERLGLDTSKAQFEWEKYTPEQAAALGDGERRFVDTLIGSNAVLKSKTPDHVDIDAEVKKWRSEFGDWWATKLEEYTRASLPDYEYLYSRRLTV